MDMKVVTDGKDKKNKGLHVIKASAVDRIIEIELERLSRRTTRMRVVANKGTIFFKDAATATEIIVQTASTLDTQTARRQSRKARKRSKKRRKR
jgi:hypothetical protein